MSNYIEQALQTKSPEFHGDKVHGHVFMMRLQAAIQHLQWLDELKKALFYGKLNEDIADDGGATCTAFPSIVNVDVIHAIIGKATEAGELLEALNGALFEGKDFDIVNFKEEIGDGLWYDAIGLNAVGGTFEEVQATNIAKLRARFPNKFTEFDANNRDLSTERKILESN